MRSKHSVWSDMMEGIHLMLAWIPRIGFEPRTVDEIQDDMNALLERRGLTVHKTDAEALASDWQAVGNDMKSALNKLGVK